MTGSASIVSDYRVPEDKATVLVDPQAYADGRIYDTYAWLRANAPLAKAEPEGFTPFWVASRHEDIQNISRQNHLFHAGDESTTFMDRQSAEYIKVLTGGSPHLVHSLVSMDPPEHMKYRKLTQSYFMPKNIRGLEDDIRKVAREFVDKMMATDGECDFVSTVALLYPLRVIMTIFGVPVEDEPIMLKLTQKLFAPQDPEVSGEADVLSAEEQAKYLHKTVAEFHEYFRELSKDRRANPRDDISSIIANAEVDGERISEIIELSYYITVATAGHDTTSSSTATAIWQLAQNPAEFEKVKADPSIIPLLVDEAIRWAAPIKSFMRHATEDTEVNGSPIKKGDWIMLAYGSGNRDEAVYENPDKFIADRKQNPLLSFGYGPHLCLGMHLARMEMRVLFEELLPRIKSLRLSGEPALGPTLFMHGPKRVPIAFEPA